MQNLRLLKASVVEHLFENVANNIDRYKHGDFNQILSDPSSYISAGIAVDVSKVAIFANGPFNESSDLECCMAIWDLLPPTALSRSVARDERLWVPLTHGTFLHYSRQRWPIPNDHEKAVSFIRKHFFARNARNVERDNAVSRLWWMSAICSVVQDSELKEVLSIFLYKSDVRANIVERPTTAQNPMLLAKVISELKRSYVTDKLLFERSTFREFAKRLNLAGGTRLLDGLADEDIHQVVTSCRE